MADKNTRTSVKALDEILGHPFPVLDHGFVRVVDYMGDDSAIVQAARVSYGTGTKTARNDEGLIRYLMRHSHTTPFEMCEIKLHIKLPVFVARQWVRHRTANINEISARYSILDREFYVPDSEQVSSQSLINNQGRGAKLADAKASDVVNSIKAQGQSAFNLYDEMLADDDEGVARELARTVLPLGAYTQWYWKIDLHNLLHFLRLRADAHAQYEIRVYAEAVINILERWVPVTARAFHDYSLHSFRLSAAMVTVVKRILRNEPPDYQAEGLSKREWQELCHVLDIRSE